MAAMPTRPIRTEQVYSVPVDRLHPHPVLSLIYEDIKGAQQTKFDADIEERGQLDPIEVIQGTYDRATERWAGDREQFTIINGKQRWMSAQRRQAKAVDIKVLPDSFRLLHVDDLIRYAASKNEHRRHLDKIGQALDYIASRPRHGGPRAKEGSDSSIAPPRMNRHEAARRAGFSSYPVAERHASIAEGCAPDVQEAFKSGEISQRVALDFVGQPAADQVAELERLRAERASAGNGHPKPVAKRPKPASSQKQYHFARIIGAVDSLDRALEHAKCTDAFLGERLTVLVRSGRKDIEDRDRLLARIVHCRAALRALSKLLSGDAGTAGGRKRARAAAR